MLEKTKFSPYNSYVPNHSLPAANSSKYQFEDIIVDEKASGTIRHKLECLAVVHRSLLFINL
jgi:hypothetical protein